MVPIIPIIFVILFLGYLAKRLNSNSDSDNDETVMDPYYQEDTRQTYESERQSAEDPDHRNGDGMGSESEKPDTFGLMFNTLNQLGCQPHKNDDGTLSVQYQGENFHMEFGGMYVRVWDPLWAGVSVDDPGLSQIREAVNIANFAFGPTVVLTAPNDKGMMAFHSRRDIMLHPACPDNVSYVRAVLDSFFDAKENVRNNYQQLNAEQKEMQSSRRPVGFTTDNQES